ncbi:TonB-dependent receptor [Parabacteroides sp. Marseille-P3160]|uniref:TonB-dependent receptor n=1 Tax=Parabacteroides sp. Marseille-P3160 TaxID=1917887 RepID=UPI0009BB7B37|nr:TonB-dependent receptor [Parabacteroides sp. Marseille-P3160]
MKKRSVLLLALSLLTVSFAAEASGPLSENDSVPMSVQAKEVVIVAFKNNKDLSRLPVSSSLLTEESLKERNVVSIKELNAFVPNFFMPEYGSKLTSPVYIRGIGSRINAPSVGLYVDGVPYFDRSSFDFNIQDVDRIEVLRGPQGTIYGRNAMGGIINVYTKSPFRYKGTDLGVSTGNYNQYKANLFHSGNVKEKFGYSVSANYQHLGGYFKNLYRKKQADRMNAFAGRIRLGWQINADWVAYLSSAYEYSDQDGYPYGIYHSENNTVDKVNYDARSFYRRNMSNNGLNLEYSTPEIRFSSQTSFQYFDGKQGIDQDFTVDDKYYVTFTHRQQMYSQEFNLKSNEEHSYQWLFGAFGFYQNYNQENDVEYHQLHKETITGVDNPSMGYAFYHQSVFRDLLLEGLALTAGIRYGWERTEMENRTTAIDSIHHTNDPIKGNDSFSRITPKVSLQYQFNTDRMVYASVSNGYKAGGFNTTAEEEKDRTFRPEKSWSYETGGKFNFFQDLIHTEVSLFYIDWRDQQISQKRATEQGFKLRNAGKSVSKGLEVMTQIQPANDMNIQLNYGYTHAKFKEFLYDEAKGIDYGGNFLPLVPRNTFSAAINYAVRPAVDWLERIDFNIQYVGLGKLYWNEDNLSEQPYYQTVNGRISLTQGNISLDIWAKNILNEKYITYYFESMGNQFAQQGRPFTVGVDVNLKF